MTSMTRRDALRLAGLSSVASLLPACASTSGAEIMSTDLADSLYGSSAQALAAGIRSGAVSSEEVTRAHLDRIQAVNPQLNAVVKLDVDGALAAARAADAARIRGDELGPLHGVPMTTKDSLDTAGMVTTWGTLGRKEFVPDRDATVVARLRAAGAILMGKTNTPEFTLDFNTVNLVYGQTLNPHDTAMSPGGSSGGAAAIVAAGGAPFDIGSDYGGSIRLPAHFNGICGIKPSTGRVSRAGHAYPFGGIQDSFQQIGPLARTVDDLALILPIIMGPDGVDPYVQPLSWGDELQRPPSGLKVAFHLDNGIVTPTVATQRAVRRAAEALSDAGAALTEARPPGVEDTIDVTMPIYFWDGGVTIKRMLEAAGTREHGLQLFTEMEPLTAEQLDGALTRLDLWRSEILGFTSQFDLLLSPVNTQAAYPAGFKSTPEIIPNFSYTMTYNASGHPVVVVPAGVSEEGLPIGVQVIANPGREDLALAGARHIEKTLGAYRRPDI